MRSTLLGVAGAALLTAGAPPSDGFPIVRTQTPSTQQATAAAVTPAASDSARRTVDVLLQAVRHLPNARADRAALFGHSRGGGAALNYALTGGDVSALVLDSTGYPGELANQVPRLHAPILILHGLRDSPADGRPALADAKVARS